MLCVNNNTCSPYLFILVNVILLIMSRLIVKNLPKSVTEEKLRSTFAEKGTVTDVQLKYKNGKFRGFGFIGFRKPEEAQAALEFFNNTCIGLNRIKVEICSDLGSSEKPRAWSKYASDSSAYKKLNPEDDTSMEKTKNEAESEKKKTVKGSKDPKIAELLDKYKDDPMFAEFMDTHLGKGRIWSNDVLQGTGDGPAADSEDLEKIARDQIPKEELASSRLSDFEYLKTKMVKKISALDVNDTPTNVIEKAEDNLPSKLKAQSDDESNSDEEKRMSKKKIVLFKVNIKNLPRKTNRKDIKKFLLPLKPKSVLVMELKKTAIVGFATEKEMKQALLRDHSFVGENRIKVKEYKEQQTNEDSQQQNNDQWIKQEDALKHEETIAESGRLFARNLSYTTTEEELTELFTKFGEVSEVTLPIDRLTRKIKGFAMISFLFPEHAVQAYNALDGTVFAGRMLHLLPAKAKPSIDDLLEEEGLDFKKKKELMQKKLATSSTNWNTLFLGQNALTEIIAENYNTTKEKVLSDDGKTSVAVRLALGETQIVAETKKFLIDNGVQLDAFNKPAVKRSKRVILVKNLPAKTSASELRQMFEKFGVVGRIILPPSGVTAIIEFMDSTEAKTAFLRLAYTKFKELPLYLEWAPVDALIAEKSTDNPEKTPEVADKPDVEVQEDPEPESILYIKNLDFAITEDEVRDHFMSCGAIAKVTLAKRTDPKNPGKTLSCGYGFIQFYHRRSADKALKTLQHSVLKGRNIELKRSHQTTQKEQTTRKSTNTNVQTGTKIIVRNIPFQANEKEVADLFRTFGEIRAIRLPKKMVGTGSHRGFAFIDYNTKHDAKRAMEQLGQSTHLYGRRLVLEWASTDDEDVETLRKRTAQHFYQDDPVKKKQKAVADVSTMSHGTQDDSEDE